MALSRLVLLVVASVLVGLLIVVAWYEPQRGYAIGQVLVAVAALVALGMNWWRGNDRNG